MPEPATLILFWRALFFLALLPQFVDPQAGRAWTQIVVLGGPLAAVALVGGRRRA